MTVYSKEGSTFHIIVLWAAPETETWVYKLLENLEFQTTRGLE